MSPRQLRGTPDQLQVRGTYIGHGVPDDPPQEGHHGRGVCVHKHLKGDAGSYRQLILARRGGKLYREEDLGWKQGVEGG